MPGILPALPGLLWGLPLLGMRELVRRKPDVADASPARGIRVSVIIPARNESATIETLLASLRETTYDAVEILVVDDRSTDDTAARVEAMVALDPRIRLLRGADLPDGWFGKPWACLQGARAATGDVLLFTDADTKHQPVLLGHAIGALHEQGADLLTLTSMQRCVTFWERVIMPQIWILLGIRYTPARINRATHAYQLVANGQFILVRRDAYWAVGGHELVKGEVVEDLALAQRMFRAGKRVRMLFGETLLETRMYRSLAEMVEGWSKNLHLGAKLSAPDNAVLRFLAPFGIMVAFLCWLLPFGLLAAGVATAAAWTAIVVSVMVWALVLGGMEIPARYALLYPLGALMALGIALRSTLRGARRVEWRGRRYDVSHAKQ